ncbi:MAG TPA: DMT family transporter [Chthoniobacterales bacterium]|jgi:drug/metabolite transporter (DMT)-like permease
MTKAKVFVLTALAMIAFAGNSLLCRLALRNTAIDAATFTFVRILSGAVCLSIIVQARSVGMRKGGNWLSALALFGYAALFSLAYLRLTAGTGALLLFAAVQATMIFWGFRKGEKLRYLQIAGVLLAGAGLVALVLPGLSAPPLGAALLMIGAGIAWGVYSLRGKAGTDPLRATAGNFLRALPMAALLGLAMWRWIKFDGAGIAYAVISGAIASGLGYAIWYTALPALKATAAATVQLSVPVLTAAGGILFLAESFTLRFALASAAVLGGIFLVIVERKPAAS